MKSKSMIRATVTLAVVLTAVPALASHGSIAVPHDDGITEALAQPQASRRDAQPAPRVEGRVSTEAPAEGRDVASGYEAEVTTAFNGGTEPGAGG
jgi:hypothetical protein